LVLGSVQLFARLAASIMRQEGFESWVVARLGRDGATPTPIDWQQAEDDIANSLKAKGEPLSGWFKSYSNSKELQH
jgi:hypothetical protein